MGWNICGKLETCGFVVRRLFSVVTRMVEIVKQYFIQRLITISNLLLQVIFILFHIFFSCFSKWNFIGYFLRQMSFKIYIDSRVSVLFSIPPTRKDFPVTDLTRNEKYFERILHGFVLLVLAGLYEYRSSQCLERTYRAKFGRFSARCFIDWNRNVLFKIRSLFEIVFFFNINWKRPKNKEFENTSMIVLKLYNFVAFSYFVIYFRNLTSLSYSCIQLLFFHATVYISSIK